MTSSARYQVVGDNFHGEGLTPGLALRSFWRAIESAARHGYPAPTHYLPPRRRYTLLHDLQYPEPPRDSGEADAVHGLTALGTQHDIGAKREARE